MAQRSKPVAPMMPTLNLMITHSSLAHQRIAILQLGLRTRHIYESLKECQMTDSMQSLLATPMVGKCECLGSVVRVH
jgi:hypothetical protein